MKDIFELAQEAKEASEYRTNQVLCGGCPRGSTREVRAFIASSHARYDSHHYQDEVTKDEILENFCWNIFGVSFDEVLKAWDRYLG